MPINPLANEESSLEKGLSVSDPASGVVKAVSTATQQQAKAFTNDLLAQLYGPSDKSADSMTDQQKQDAAKQSSQKPPPKPVRILGGMANSGDHAKYAAMQKQLEGGDQKGADLTMHHMQHYYDDTVGTLDEQMRKAEQKRLQEERERQQKMQEEEEEKKKKEAQEKEQLPQATGKGRNKMGMPPQKKQKTDMGLKMGQMKTETFRGASG